MVIRTDRSTSPLAGRGTADPIEVMAVAAACLCGAVLPLKELGPYVMGFLGRGAP